MCKVASVVSTLCDPMFSVHGILQERILERVVARGLGSARSVVVAHEPQDPFRGSS